jgi:hypothetical protein
VAGDTPDDTGAGQPTVAELAERQDRTDSKVDQILGIVSKLAPGAPPAATDTTQDRLDAPGTVAEQVRDELARRDKAAEEASLKDTVGGLAETVKGLTEAKPRDPQRRVTRIMFGADDG